MHKFRLIKTSNIVAAMLLAFTLAPFANAQDSDRGNELAQRWCVNCHLISAEGPGTDIGPAFSTLANDLLLSDHGLRSWLLSPHDPMPDLALSDPEIADIIAYIRTLSD